MTQENHSAIKLFAGLANAAMLESSLLMQFMSESILLSLVVGILAVWIVQLVLPAFSEVVGARLSMDFSNPRYWIWANPSIGNKFITFAY